MADGYKVTVSTLVGGTAVGKYVPKGVVLHCEAAFLNSAGAAADPATVKFAYQAAAIGVTTTLTYGVDAALVKKSTGVFYVDMDTGESAGEYDWRWFTTGTGQAAQQGTFYARSTET